MIVKILGAIDILSSLTLTFFIFGIHPISQLILFCSGLLFIKGLFIFSGEPLSLIDLLGSLILLISIFFTFPIMLYWIFAFILMAKGFVSFL